MPRLGYRQTTEAIAKIRAARALQVFSDETRQRRSATAKRLGIRPPVHFGEDHPRWKGGVSRDRHSHDKRYRDWRTAVFTRDQYRCVLCGVGGYLEADHIEAWSKRPDLRYDVANGRTLCRPCHAMTPNYKGRVHRRGAMGVGL